MPMPMRRISLQSPAKKTKKIVIPEKVVLKIVTQYLEAKGILYIRHHPLRLTGKAGALIPVKGAKSSLGAPDILIFIEDKVIACECKASNGRLSENQIDWHNRFSRSMQENGICVIVRQLDDLVFLIDRILE